jgi:hypothetical protein
VNGRRHDTVPEKDVRQHGRGLIAASVGLVPLLAATIVVLAAKPSLASITNVDPPSGSLQPGGSMTATVTVVAGDSSGEPDASSCLSVEGLPSGLTVHLVPQCGSGEFRSEMNVDAAEDSEPGSFSITILEADSESGSVIDGQDWNVIVEEGALPSPEPTTPPPTTPPPPPPSPTSPPPPQDIADIVSRELEGLGLGQIVFTAPSNMKLGTDARVIVRISKDLQQDLSKGLKQHGVPVREEIPVDTLMKATLKGDAFEIEPLSDEEQLVGETSFTQWEWLITPQSSGDRSLFLTVAVRIRIEGAGQEIKSFPVFERQIDVRVDFWFAARQFLSANWQWLVTTAIGSGLVGWLFQRRRRARS